MRKMLLDKVFHNTDVKNPYLQNNLPVLAYFFFQEEFNGELKGWRAYRGMCLCRDEYKTLSSADVFMFSRIILTYFVELERNLIMPRFSNLFPTKISKAYPDVCFNVIFLMS